MLILQIPGSGDLLHHLNEAANGASNAFGAFAFATKAGIEAVFNQTHIKKVAKSGNFELIVGIDAITNVDAINELKRQMGKLKGLNVRIFKHDFNSSTFHPKFSWFGHNDKSILITGSGNLTSAGLGGKKGSNDGNWEAFTVRQLDNNETQEISTQWQNLITAATQNGQLLSIDDKAVLEEAIKNNRTWPKKAKTAKPKSATPSKKKSPKKPAVIEVEGSQYIDKVQISEISRNRWPQADLGKSVLCDFFGFDENQPDREVIIQHVNPDDSLGEIETRHMFKNQSANYRFELGAGRGQTYEVSKSDDRPIVVFVQIGESVFRYHLMMPSTHSYKDVLKLLGSKKSGAGRKMRKLQTDIDSMRQACPQLPDQLFPEIIETTQF